MLADRGLHRNQRRHRRGFSTGNRNSQDQREEIRYPRTFGFYGSLALEHRPAPMTTRSEALALGLTRFRGRPCRRCNGTKGCNCIPCHKIHTKNLVKGAELYRARQRWRRAANLETARAYDRERYAIGTGKILVQEYPARGIKARPMQGCYRTTGQPADLLRRDYRRSICVVQ
jgi:hypothetical protein